MLLGRVHAIGVQLDEAGVQLAGIQEGRVEEMQIRGGTLSEMVVAAAAPMGATGYMLGPIDPSRQRFGNRCGQPHFDGRGSEAVKRAV